MTHDEGPHGHRQAEFLSLLAFNVVFGVALLGVFGACEAIRHMFVAWLRISPLLLVLWGALLVMLTVSALTVGAKLPSSVPLGAVVRGMTRGLACAFWVVSAAGLV